MFKNMEKYIANLSPELQEKARNCKNMDEFKAFIAQNNIELSEDALEAVSGGFEALDEADSATRIRVRHPWHCPSCGQELKPCLPAAAAHDMEQMARRSREQREEEKRRLLLACINPNCIACKESHRFRRRPDSKELIRVK